MKICMDTCAYSKLGLHLPTLICYVNDAEQVFVSSVVLGELFAGFGIGKREKENRESLRRFLELPAVNIIKVDESIAERYGLLVKTLREQGTPIPANDIWIAATAMETGSRLVTYDAHFGRIPGLVVAAP